MRLKEVRYAYTFDDLMLVPQHSEVKSRKAPNVKTTVGNVELDIPIMSAPMNTVTEVNMAAVLSNLGGAPVVHRYMSADDMVKMATKIIAFGCNNKVFYAVGAAGDYFTRVEKLRELGVKNFCVDVANGHSEICLKAVESIRNSIPDANIMAGNVCTYDGARRLVEVGTNVVRVGVGPGSMCKTRIVTGHGVPQLSAIDDCVDIKNLFAGVSIVADGGIRNSGDIVKALAIGADAVMVGGLLAGTDETPGEIYDWHTLRPGDYRQFKKYAGMASEEGRKFNGWFTEEDASFVPEGESTEIPYKGPVKNVIDNLVGGLRVGMSYAGALSLQELRENAEWVRVTQNGHIEGTPHGKSR